MKSDDTIKKLLKAKKANMMESTFDGSVKEIIKIVKTLYKTIKMLYKPIKMLLKCQKEKGR